MQSSRKGGQELVLERVPGPRAEARGATTQTMRRANRALLLNLIREHAPVSRPRLAVLSGIHRSNVAVIAGELIREGLVYEATGQAQGRGRVAGMLTLANEAPVVLGISVRPGETTGLLARLDGTTEKAFQFPTPAAPQDFISQLREHCVATRSLKRRLVQTVRQVVIAVPGRVLPNAGLWIPDLPLYAHFPLDAAVGKLLDRPVALANGGNVAAVAALRSEGTRDAVSNLAFVAVHEDGVGGGVISGGRLFSGFDGTFAGEFGHMQMEGEGPPCACGSRGCWGQLVSGHAVWRTLRPRQAFNGDAYRALLQSAPADKSIARLMGSTISTLLRGIRNIVVTFNPQRIVVAGDLTLAWKLVAEQLAREPIFPDFAGRIVPAALPLRDLYEAGTVQHGLSQIFQPEGEP